jgi:hypothetical protein
MTTSTNRKATDSHSASAQDTRRDVQASSASQIAGQQMAAKASDCRYSATERIVPPSPLLGC